ncbi:MAG: PAS domain S-box protein [Candidatus Bathyarchaeia archaeon]
MVESAVQSQAEIIISSAEKKPIRVLHVDDEPGLLKVAKQCLELQGPFEVDVAGSVDEALAKLEKENYDAVVSDFQMPRKDGLEFLDELRTGGNMIPFILFTGKGREEVAIKALNLGADQYLDKMGDPETVHCQLAHAIIGAVERKRLLGEKLRIDMALKRCGERYEHLFESAVDGMIINGPDGCVSLLNSALASMLGYDSPKELIGKPAAQFYADPEARSRALKELTDKGFLKDCELLWKKKDGTLIEILVNASVERDENGKVLRTEGIIRDVTEKNRALQTLRESESKYRILVENLPQKIFLKDANSVYVSCNESYARDLKIEADEISGKTDHDFYPKELAEKYRADDERIMASGNTESLEESYIQDGQRVSVHTVKTPVKDEKGNVVGIIGIFEDITERKKAEREIRIRDAALASSIGAVAFADLEGNLTYVNNSFLRTWGYANDKEVLGRPAAEFWLAEEKAVEIVKALNDGVGWIGELTAKKKDDSTFEAQLSASLVKDETGKPLCMMASFLDITERKKAEQALKKSEEKYRSLVELAPDGIVAVDTEGIVTSVNRSFLTLVGYDSEEGIVGKPFAELVTMRREDIQRFQGMFMSLMKGESPSPSEFLYVRRDGTSRWAEVHPSLMIKDGNPVGVQAIMRDVTDRKKAEEALMETKDYLDNLLNYANAPIIVWDNERKISLFNNAFEALAGYKKEFILGRNIDVLFPPLQKTEILQIIERATRGEKWRSVEVPILCKDEETRIVLWNSANIHDKDGKMVATIAQGQDITERKALEDALKDAKQKWMSLTENTDDIVMIVDSEGIIQYINRTIPPYTPEGTIGKTVYEYVPREQHDTMRSSLKKTFETGVPLSYVVSSNIPKIGTIWFKTKMVPVKDDEKTASAILMSTDITELKNAEERLKETNMRLEVTNEKLHVVGGLTRHDVRNKLSAVTGNAYLLKRKLAQDPKALEQLNDMEANVRLVERIFEFARVYEKLGVEQPSYMDVGKSVDEAASLFSDLKGVKIVNECGGLTVLADSLLNQLFYNLVDNSLKYGEKIRQIKIHYRTPSADQLELVYEDDGVGIPDSMRSNLFKEGFTSGKGTGYGLFMIKRICEVYGWTVQETGTPGKGACFIMSMPRKNREGKENFQLR